MNATEGQFFVGESGTELLFRLIMNACLGTDNSGVVLGSTVEHPATRSACARWSKISGKQHVLVPHDDDKGLVTDSEYSKYITKDTKVATILHTSPVTGMGMNIGTIAKAIRNVSPDSFEDLRSKFNDVCFAIIMQSTKDGTFKGSNEYAHNSDINIKIHEGKAITIKNRFSELKSINIF